MADKDVKVPAPQPLEFRRDDDFVSRYANNVQIESSAFDMKLVFGVLDQSAITTTRQLGARQVIEQHTSINLSWPEVKLLVFYMQVHLAGHEKENGKVKVNASVLPPEPPALPEGFDNPKNREGMELIRKMRAEFLASLSEI